MSDYDELYNLKRMLERAAKSVSISAGGVDTNQALLSIVLCVLDLIKRVEDLEKYHD